MSLEHILILLATGVVAGFASGLLGLGGAFLMTPMQYLVYTDMGLSADIAIKMAFGTSLLAVLTTAISGAWRHHRQNLVNWRLALAMGTGSMVFAFVGATISAHLPGNALKIAFGAIAIISSIRMFFITQETDTAKPVNKIWVWIVWSVPVGLLAGILGVGGGVLLIPILVLALRFKVHNAVANSLAVIIFTSIGGIIGYIVNGIGTADRLSYSLGYIHLPSWLLLAIPSALMAQVGAVLSHRMRGKILMYIFIIVLLYMGLRMIGVFEWLNWPI